MGRLVTRLLAQTILAGGVISNPRWREWTRCLGARTFCLQKHWLKRATGIGGVPLWCITSAGRKQVKHGMVLT